MAVPVEINQLQRGAAVDRWELDQWNRRELTAALILEEIDAVVRLVRAGDHEVEIAIAICITGHRPGPEADFEIDDETGVVVLDRVQAFGGEGAGANERQEAGLEELHERQENGWRR